MNYEKTVLAMALMGTAGCMESTAPKAGVMPADVSGRANARSDSPGVDEPLAPTGDVSARPAASPANPRDRRPANPDIDTAGEGRGAAGRMDGTAPTTRP